MGPAFMGESELFSDQKSDFERSYRREILVAVFLAPPYHNLQRLAVTMAYLSSTETKYCIRDGGAGEKAFLGAPS